MKLRKRSVWLETSTEPSWIKSIGNDVLIKPSISSNSKFLFICKLFLTVILKGSVIRWNQTLKLWLGSLPICCIFFIDIGLVAVLYDYNFPKQDLLKNSLIVSFFCCFLFVWSIHFTVTKPLYVPPMFNSMPTGGISLYKRSLQNRHPKNGCQQAIYY